MKIKNQRSLISLCYLTLFFCALCLYVVAADIISGLKGFEFSPDPKFAHYFIFYGKHFFSIALVGVLSAIIVNTLKGIKTNNAFPKKNVTLIYVLAVVDMLMHFCSCNWHILNGERYISIDGDVLITPMVLVIFGILYSMAHKASVDSNLAI